MDIQETTAKVRSGEISQHGHHRAQPWTSPPAITRIRALLRSDAAERASALPAPATTRPRHRPTAGEVATATADHATARQASDLPALKAALGRLPIARLREMIDEHNEEEDDDMDTTGDKRALVKRIMDYAKDHLPDE